MTKTIEKKSISGKITVVRLLTFYSELIDKKKIAFIKYNDRVKVLKLIHKLIAIFEDADVQLSAEKENNPNTNKNLSDFIKTHTIHEEGKKLWEKLCSLALFNIDPTSKGNSTIYKYLEEATKFEDLLYGLEVYYRDHTLHSLWVYFLGEYLMREPLKNLQGDAFNWYIFNDIKKEKDKFEYPDEYVTFSIYEFENKFKQIINQKKDSIWCIIALCHDLGYSLEKLEKLNSSVEEVLKYFSIKKNENLGYSLNIEQQFLVNQFLELMAMDVRIIPSDEYRDYFDYLNTPKQKENLDLLKKFTKLIKKPKTSLTDFDNKEIKKLRSNPLIKNINELILTKCYRDDSTYWRLCQSLEKKKHGILSSYLLFKVIGLFAESSIMGPGEEWGLSDEEAIENIIHGNILFAIAQHTFDFAHLFELNSLSDILILVDDLEEFSRFGRQLQSREYYDTTAEVEIIFNPPNPKPSDKIDIEIIYFVRNNLEDNDIRDFFYRKAEQLCRTYSLSEKKSDYCKISSIKLTTKSEDKNLELVFFLSEKRDKIKGQLPKNDSPELDKPIDEGEYRMKCIDDKLLISEDKRKKVPRDILLSEWLQIKKK